MPRNTQTLTTCKACKVNNTCAIIDAACILYTELKQKREISVYCFTLHALRFVNFCVLHRIVVVVI